MNVAAVQQNSERWPGWIFQHTVVSSLETAALELRAPQGREAFIGIGGSFTPAVNSSFGCMIFAVTKAGKD